jgi:hypothetical protein
MKLIVRDQKGRTITLDRVTDYLGSDRFGAAEVNVEASRVEGLGIQLADSAEVIIVTLDMEEV